jgi:HSP20 family protein
LASTPELYSTGTARASFLLSPGSTVKQRKYDQATFSPFGRTWSRVLSIQRSGNLWSAPSSRAIRLFFSEDLAFEEFESFPKHVEEFFDLIARRPFELLEKRPWREFENLCKTEPELMRPIYLKLYETEEALVARAEVPGFTEKELRIVAESWRPVIIGKRECQEEAKIEEKKESPLHTERMHIDKTVKFPVEIGPEGVKAILKNGILGITLPKAEVVKKVKIEVKPLCLTDSAHGK